MALIVQKFGGSSVANADRVRNVARIITETYRKGHSVVVVLSAQGDTTDDLIAKAAQINPHASKREMDMLLSTGEQISCSLCAMAIEAMGYPVVSLTGWQAGFRTNSSYGDARIKRIDTERVLAELGENDRLALTLYYLNDRPIKDIAEMLESSEGAVKQRLSHGRKKFKEAYEERETGKVVARHAKK